MATAKTPAKKAAPKKTATKPMANSCGAKDKCLPPEVAKKIAAKKPAAPVALPSLVRVNLAELGAGAAKHIDAFFDMKNVPSSWKGVIISEPVQQTVQVEKELLVNVHTVQVTKNDGQLTKSRTRAAQWLRGLAAEYNASVWLRTAVSAGTNGGTWDAAHRLALDLGATEPVEQRQRDFHFPTADELREQIKGMQGMLASLGRARGLLVELDSVLRMAESHNGGALTAAHVRAAVEPYLPLDLGPNVEFSGVPVGHSINHPAGGTSAATQG